ncbi:MAG: hypothetical protein GH156_00555 [Dehalococcoidia bacterium]|nr:hypothetical protein [Dehalococcoidia bacterium]
MGAGAELWIWDKENREWVKLAGTAAGAMSIHAIVEELDDIEDVDLTGLADDYIIYWDDASSTWKCKLVSATKLIDADGDTKVDVEEGADEDIVRMDVAGVEAFHLSALGILTLAKQSICRAYKSAVDQTIGTSALTKIVLDGEDYDNLNEFDSTTNYRFTATEAGYYLVVGQLFWICTVDQKEYTTLIYKNGADESKGRLRSAVGASEICPAHAVVYLAAGDFIEIWGWQSAGINQNVAKDRFMTHLDIHKLS